MSHFLLLFAGKKYIIFNNILCLISRLVFAHHFVGGNIGLLVLCDSERGKFCEDMFPLIEMPVVEHIPWALKNIPIPPGLYGEVCKIIKTKLDAGVYEPSNSSYQSRWFCVVKKDKKSLRLVHSLEPLNQVTIAHSGLPPATDRKSTRLNSSHVLRSRMPSSA